MTDIYALAASSHMAFAAFSTGLLRSLDGGQSWRPAFSWLEEGSTVLASAVSLTPPLDGIQAIFAAVPGAVLRSMDGGDSWETSVLPKPAPFITSLAVSPGYARDRTLFVASLEDGVFRSTDGGASFISWNFGLLDYQVLSMAISPAFESDRALFIGTGSGLFTSLNAGRAWREILLPCAHKPILSLACTPDLLLAGTESCGLYASKDGGQTWQQWAEGIFDTVNLILADGAATLVLTEESLFISRDLGQTWQMLPTKDGQIPVGVCAPGGLSVGNSVLVGYEGGIIHPLIL